MIKLQKLPEVGKEYGFFDSGNLETTVYYKAFITNIISKKQAKSLQFADGTLYEIWEDEKTMYSDFYSEYTDVFIESTIPGYDDGHIYFCRHKDGGWYSFDVTSNFQSGRLDIDGSLYETYLKLI